jgi:hypothetical protein
MAEVRAERKRPGCWVLGCWALARKSETESLVSEAISLVLASSPEPSSPLAYEQARAQSPIGPSP